MAEPARVGADEPGPAGARRPDPRAPGWAYVQQAMITDADALVLATQEMLRRPDNDAARKIAELILASLQSLGELTTRNCAVDEAVLAEQRQRGFDEGVAACKAARCRLQVIDGGLVAGPH
jgi:hypothetical protein